MRTALSSGSIAAIAPRLPGRAPRARERRGRRGRHPGGVRRRLPRRSAGPSPQAPRAWLLMIAENVRRRRFRTSLRRPYEEPLDAEAALAAEESHAQASLFSVRSRRCRRAARGVSPPRDHRPLVRGDRPADRLDRRRRADAPLPRSAGAARRARAAAGLRRALPADDALRPHRVVHPDAESGQRRRRRGSRRRCDASGPATADPARRERGSGAQVAVVARRAPPVKPPRCSTPAHSPPRCRFSETNATAKAPIPVAVQPASPATAAAAPAPAAPVPQPADPQPENKPVPAPRAQHRWRCL